MVHLKYATFTHASILSMLGSIAIAKGVKVALIYIPCLNMNFKKSRIYLLLFLHRWPHISYLKYGISQCCCVNGIAKHYIQSCHENIPNLFHKYLELIMMYREAWCDVINSLPHSDPKIFVFHFGAKFTLKVLERQRSAKRLGTIFLPFRSFPTFLSHSLLPQRQCDQIGKFIGLWSTF